MKFLASIYIILLGITLAVPTALYAADHVVAPLALYFDLESRDIVSDTITISNPTDRQIRLYASVNQVSTDGDGVLESFQPPVNLDRTNSPTSWIEITRSRIELAPGEKQTIPFTIRMNPKTKAGDYDVFIGFAAASNVPAATKKVLAGEAPGTLLRISVDQKQNIFLRLERFFIDRFVMTTKDKAAQFTVTNPGFADVTPQGEIIFYASNGQEVGAVPLNTASEIVSGESTKAFSVPLPDDLEMGKYKAFLSVEYGEFLTASLNDTTFFYVLPWHYLLFIFVLLLFITLLLTWYIHRSQQPLDPHDADQLPFYVSTERSQDRDHDIDLKKMYEK